MYAQKIEGDSWLGEKIDKGKIDKMSGMQASTLTMPKVLIQISVQISSSDNFTSLCKRHRIRDTIGTTKALEVLSLPLPTAPAHAESFNVVNVLPGTHDLLEGGQDVIGNSFPQLDSSAPTFFSQEYCCPLCLYFISCGPPSDS